MSTPRRRTSSSDSSIIGFIDINRKLDQILQNQKLMMIWLQNPPATAALTKAVERVSLKAKKVDQLVPDKTTPPNTNKQRKN